MQNKDSGLYRGKRHKDGGIPVIVDGNTPVEVEGGEYKICRDAYYSNDILSFKNKTNKEILDYIHNDFGCKFEQNKAQSGDFILCRLVVGNDERKDRQGTVEQILNEMQDEVGCKIENADRIKKEGGEVGNQYQLTKYILSAETENDSKELYSGYDYNRAKSEFDSVDINDYDDEHGFFAVLGKVVYDYQFVGSLDEDESIDDYPFTVFYDDEDYYKLQSQSDFEEIDTKVVENVNKASDSLLNDVENYYASKYNKGYSAKYINIQVTNGLDYYDENHIEYGCVQLRFADHSWNAANNDRFGNCDYYISIVIANKNKTKERFGVSMFELKNNEVELTFNSDDDFDSILSEIDRQIEEAKEYVIEKHSGNNPDIKYGHGGGIKTDFNDYENDDFSKAMLSLWNDFTNGRISNYLNIENENYVLNDQDGLMVIFRNKDLGDFTKVEREYIGNWFNTYLDANKKPFISKYIDTFYVEANRIIIKLKPQIMYAKGGRTIAQTPAPKKDRVYGSDVNKPESAKDIESAESISFDDKTLHTISNKIETHNKKYPNKHIDLATAKAVVRRGMGAYSKSHRPTISGGMPNDRTAWGLARLNAFIYKVEHGSSKSGKYIQDDDLLDELGIKHKNYAEGGLIAPNGKPSNLTPEQYKLVRTSEFKAWFGDWENDPENSSKVIDENGEPLVVYHFTEKKFNVFELKGISDGFFFTPIKNDEEFYYEGNKSKSFFLSIKRLAELRDMPKNHWSIPFYENEWISTSKSDGGDGIQFVREDDNKKIIVAFYPEQIKLADGTNTTFDGNNPDIRYEDGGEVLLAPNGKPSNLNPEQWHLVRTPEFKAWFGDWENDPKNASKVIDENGEPLVVYRGFNKKSDAGFVFKYKVNRFKHNRKANRFAHYFTRSKNVALEYAEQGEKIDDEDVIVKSYFLKCDKMLNLTKENPLYPTYEEWIKTRHNVFLYSPHDIVEKLKKRSIPIHSYLFDSVLSKAKNENDINELSELKINELVKQIKKEEKEELKRYESSEDVNFFHLFKLITGKEASQNIANDIDEYKAEARRDVYNYFINYKPSDSIIMPDLDLFLKNLIIENNFNGGKFNEWQFGVKKQTDKEVYFVFESNQIKLADGTNTTFDGNNPDIRYKKGGEVTDGKFNTPIMYHEKNGNFFVGKNTIYMWLYDDENAGEKINNGEYDFVLFPPATPYGAFAKGYVPPLLKVWTKPYQKKHKGSEHLMGIIEAWYDEVNKKMYINMMTTNPKLRGQGIMSYMVKQLRTEFDLSQEDLIFVDTTKEGKQFEEAKHYKEGGSIEFKANYDKYFEYVPVSELAKYREFDRAKEKKWGSSDNTLDELISEIQLIGIANPITLQVDDINNVALIVEGNTRLAAAEHLGLKYVPVKIVHNTFGSINKHKAQKIKKRQMGEMKVFYPNVELLNYDNSPAYYGFNSLPKMESGGEISDADKKETYAKWSKLINMSASELKRFYDSDEGKVAGLTKKEAEEQGIHSGRESARWIMKMKHTPYTQWTPTMWEWANRQISFVSRMSGMKGELFKDGKPTRKLLALKIWGNDPERYESGGQLGEKGFLRFTDKVEMPFTYKLIEAKDLIPSHLPSGERNPLHTIAEGQPKERNDVSSRLAQDEIAESPRFKELTESTNAYFGAPVVNKQGEVIQGNNRSIGLKKHYSIHGTSYKKDLTENSERFGFTKEQVESMNEPILVREVPADFKLSIELGNYDVKDLETGGKQRIDPLVISRKISPKDKIRLSDIVFTDAYKTTKEAIRDNISEIGSIIKQYINSAQYETLFSKQGELTTKGIDDIDGIINHFLFDGGDVILPDIFVDLPATIQTGLQKSLKYIYNVPESKSILPEIQEAMKILDEYQSSDVDDFREWENQIEMFTMKSPIQRFKPETLKLAKLLKDAKKQSDIINYMKEYSNLVSDKPADMFSPEIKGMDKDKAFSIVFGTEIKKDKKEKMNLSIVQPDEPMFDLSNYKNPYEVNRAIEKFLDTKGDDRADYTPSEIEFISNYSGYGGLEKKGTFSQEELKGLLYEYFTPDEVVKKMWGLAYKYGYGSLSNQGVFEPSCGIGAFLKYAPENVPVVGNEINKYSAMIAKVLYPNAAIKLQYFEQNFIKNNDTIKAKIDKLEKYGLVIGNPPYGDLGGKYQGMGEKDYSKATNFIEYFIFRGLDLLIPNGLLIYIVGAEQKNGGTLFLDGKNKAIKNAIHNKAELLDAYRLPINIFERTGVSSEILVFKKR